METKSKSVLNKSDAYEMSHKYLFNQTTMTLANSLPVLSGGHLAIKTIKK